MNELALQYSFYNILIKLFIMIITLTLIFSGMRDFKVVIYSVIFGQIGADLIYIIKNIKLFNLNIKEWIDFSLIKRMFYFGFPIVISASLASLLNFVDRLFLNHFSNYFELGVYNAGLKLVSIVTIVQTMFTNFWIPVSYRWMSEKINIKHFQIVSDIILIIMSSMTMMTLLIGPLVVLILSPEYQDIQFYFPMMTLPIVLYTLSETTNLGIMFSRKSYLNIVVSVASLLINTILLILLTPLYGARGAALSTAVAYIIFYITRTFFSKQNGFDIKNRLHYVVIFYLLFSTTIKAYFNLSGWINLLLILGYLLVASPIIISIYHRGKSNPNIIHQK